MIKNNRPAIIALILFLLINTSYFWEGLLGLWNMLIILLYLASFIYLLIAIVYHFIQTIKERGKNKLRVCMLTATVVFTALVLWRPYGLINFGQLEGKDLLIAENNGSANCGTVLKLKQHNKYTMRSVCFGVYKISGIYTIHDSIITFKTTSFSRQIPLAFGVIRKDRYHSEKGKYEILIHKSNKDTMPLQLSVTKNSLLDSSNIKHK